MSKKVNSNNLKKKETKEDFKDIFEIELSKIDPIYREKLNQNRKLFDKFYNILEKKNPNKTIGISLVPETLFNKNQMPELNFEKLKFVYLLDDFERPISEFNVRILLGDDFHKFLVAKQVEEFDNLTKNKIVVEKYYFKENENIEFFGTSIRIFRENCYDANYNSLKDIGMGVLYKDRRNFLSALKTIEMHKNASLQKFEKYVVAYVGAGSWLRAETSNDFDVFIVVDDTDVKKVPRQQVKDQLSNIIWQMSYDVAALTGVQLHIQIYLLTDFWESVKEAHPVIFTFLRDGVPFYDRGIYSAWKELLKLGKIRPSQESIDLHMNSGFELIKRAKKVFLDIGIHEIYNAILSPAQAILMMKGFNPTTPKETMKLFETIVFKKHKNITKKELDIVTESIGLFKKIENDKNFTLNGSDLDRLIKNAENVLNKFKKIFENENSQKAKENVSSNFDELIFKIKSLKEFENAKLKNFDDLKILKEFEKEFLKNKKIKNFMLKYIKDIISFIKKIKDNKKIEQLEINKTNKEIKILINEIKNIKREEISSLEKVKKITLNFDNKEIFEVFNYDKKTYLLDIKKQDIFEFDNKDKIAKLKNKNLEFNESNKFSKILIEDKILKAIRKEFKVKKIFFE